MKLIKVENSREDEYRDDSAEAHERGGQSERNIGEGCGGYEYAYAGERRRSESG